MTLGQTPELTTPKRPVRAWSARNIALRLSANVSAHSSKWVVLVVALFCLLALGLTVTKRPWCDEGWFASIAYNLIHHGVMGLTVLDPHGFIFAPLVKDIDRYTYWVMPGYIFMQVAWYKLFGLSLFTMRSLSVVWGAIAVISWYYIVACLTKKRIIGLLAASVLAVDQNFVVAGASGRMDIICSGMSLLGVAAYLRLRQRFHLAIFTACAILSLAMMTHPNALFGAILLLLIVLWHDRSRIRWTTVMIAGAPFVVGLGLWALYVLRAPDVFVAQMQAQSAVPHRFNFDWNLFEQVKRELTTRFGTAYRLRSPSILVKITGLPAVLYFLSVIALGLISGLRKRTGATLILTLAVLDFLLLSCLQDNWYYLVYILPAFSAAVAITLMWLWQRGWRTRIVAGLAVAAILTLNIGVIGFRIFHNDYRHRYEPVVAYLTKHAAPDALILGSGELAFDLGFDGRVIDDCRLGYTSGRQPDYIVLEAQYYAFWFSWLSTHEPGTFKYITTLLNDEYEKIYDQTYDKFRTMGTSDRPYQIYKRKD
jgi:4-amino-4-deoxy-L-arabinose transferase-like glycosyltransferase